jgi:hypothetical protein
MRGISPVIFILKEFQSPAFQIFSIPSAFAALPIRMASPNSDPVPPGKANSTW